MFKVLTYKYLKVGINVSMELNLCIDILPVR